MVKTVLPLSLIVFLFTPLFIQKSHAEGKSSVDVHINNSVNTGSNSEGSKDCNTSVKITVNGETKSYDSTDCNKDINVQSDNGGAKVEVNNASEQSKAEVHNNDSATTVEQNTTPTPTSEAKQEIRKQIEEVKKILPKEKKNFFQTLLDSFMSFMTLEKK